MGTIRDVDVLGEAAASGAFKHWLLTKDAGAAPSFSKCLNVMYSLCMLLASVQLLASWDKVILAELRCSSAAPCIAIYAATCDDQLVTEVARVSGI